MTQEENSGKIYLETSTTNPLKNKILFNSIIILLTIILFIFGNMLLSGSKNSLNFYMLVFAELCIIYMILPLKTIEYTKFKVTDKKILLIHKKKLGDETIEYTDIQTIKTRNYLLERELLIKTKSGKTYHFKNFTDKDIEEVKNIIEKQL